MNRGANELLSARTPRDARRHAVLRVPESHTLYVGPVGCMRRHALRTHEAGDAGNSSYLAVSEETVACEGYEALIAQAVDEILSQVAPTARAVFVSLFCIDDFLGTDEEALLEGLAEAHPGVRFAVDRTHPIAATAKAGMGEKKQTNLYSLLEPVGAEEHDQGVNLVGNFAPLPVETEFFDVLRGWGLGPVRQLFDCTTYDEYASLACSRVNIVLRAQSMPAALEMQRRLGIPAFPMPATYDPAQVKRAYAELAGLLGLAAPDCSGWRARAERATSRAAAALEDRSVAVDCKASLNPHSVARALLDAGIDVRWVLRSKHLFTTDAEDARIIEQRRPQVLVMRNDDPRLGTSASPIAPDPDVVAVGSDAARLFGSRGWVDMWHDEGFFGFQGIELLMDKLARAAQGGRR